MGPHNDALQSALFIPHKRLSERPLTTVGYCAAGQVVLCDSATMQSPPFRPADPTPTGCINRSVSQPARRTHASSAPSVALELMVIRLSCLLCEFPISGDGNTAFQWRFAGCI